MSQSQGSGHACGGPMGSVSSNLLSCEYIKADKTRNYKFTYQYKFVFLGRYEIRCAFLAQFDSPEYVLGYFTRFRSDYKLDLNPFIYPYFGAIIQV